MHLWIVVAFRVVEVFIGGCSYLEMEFLAAR